MSKAIVILGPTASGKSALALELAKHVDIEIISLDSALIYKGMDIGTAKPTKEELASVPHHLIDICDPKENYSAAQFRKDCIKLVEDITQRGKIPVICGGTMMYYKALTDGLSAVPATLPSVRKKINQEGESIGWPAMHERLKLVDPISYKKLNPNDKQRVARALEVYYQTGRPMSSFMKEKQGKCPFERLEFILLPESNDRKELKKVITERFDKMIEAGLIDEVKALKQRRDLNLEKPSIKCVGYRQVWEYLDGAYPIGMMIELCINATAHLAKHQMTWLRGSLSKDDSQLVKQRLNIGDKENVNIILNAIKEHF